MAKGIGATFADELRAAGVSLEGIAWGDDGVVQYRADVAPAVRDAVAAVYAVHDPAKKSPDGDGFLTDLQALLDAATFNTLLTRAPVLIWALRGRNWAVAQAFLIAAHTGGNLSDGQYATIKAMVTNRALPIVLT